MADDISTAITRLEAYLMHRSPDNYGALAAHEDLTRFVRAYTRELHRRRVAEQAEARLSAELDDATRRIRDLDDRIREHYRGEQTIR